MSLQMFKSCTDHYCRCHLAPQLIEKAKFITMSCRGPETSELNRFKLFQSCTYTSVSFKSYHAARLFLDRFCGDGVIGGCVFLFVAFVSLSLFGSTSSTPQATWTVALCAWQTRIQWCHSPNSCAPANTSEYNSSQACTTACRNLGTSSLPAGMLNCRFCTQKNEHCTRVPLYWP